MSPDSTSFSMNDALDVLNHWRSCHTYPLHATTMTLRNRAGSIQQDAPVVQRLKRRISIENKLTRFQSMKLSQMQDIAGARVVLEDMDRVRRLRHLYESGRQYTQSQLHRVYDYIDKPKSDGYRGVHYIYRYYSTTPKYAHYDGYQVELQLRSRLQHAWATATETVSAFTGQRLKAGLGQREWKRFFLLVSQAFAMMEGTPPVVGVSVDPSRITREVSEATKALNVINLISGLGVVVDLMGRAAANAFILLLDTKENKLTVYGFGRISDASERYARMESDAEVSGQDVVLVLGHSMRELRQGYPNYHADVEDFLAALRQVCDGRLDQPIHFG